MEGIELIAELFFELIKRFLRLSICLLRRNF